MPFFYRMFQITTYSFILISIKSNNKQNNPSKDRDILNTESFSAGCFNENQKCSVSLHRFAFEKMSSFEDHCCRTNRLRQTVQCLCSHDTGSKYKPSCSFCSEIEFRIRASEHQETGGCQPKTALKRMAQLTQQESYF